MTPPAAPSRKPRIVIIGAGFGGLEAAKGLAGVDAEITLIDKRNFHLFQPLLYQVATAGLSPANVAWPIRSIFSRQKNVRVVLADVTDIDAHAMHVRTEDRDFPYDHLVIATGAKHSYFGNEEWEPNAPGLKRVIDATEIRKRILLAFERAEMAQDEDERRRHMTFVIVGGGPTGVEMAGAIAELANHALADDFLHIDPRSAHIVLAEAGDRVLKAFPEELSAYAQTALERLGVDVRLGERVDVEPEGVVFDGEPLPCATVVWAAGVTVPRVGRWLGIETDRSGQVPVDDRLRVPGLDRVHVIGDAAQVDWPSAGDEGDHVPGIAPAAKQQGKYVARLLRRQLAGQADPPPFEYRHAGNLATIGRHSAVVDFGRFRFTGAPAWWFWGLAHIYFLIGVRAPFLVAAQWFWSYLTYGKGARLITGRVPLFEAEQLANEKSAAERKAG